MPQVSSLVQSSDAVALVAAHLGCDPANVSATAADAIAKELDLLPAAQILAYRTVKKGVDGVYVKTSALGAGQSSGAAFVRVGSPDDELTQAHVDAIAKMAAEAAKVATALETLAIGASNALMAL